MYRILALFFIFNFSNYLYGQSNRVAILDFENISGISKYDGLGKAMSSMLISDIEANVSPKRLQLIERSQVQKILKEQNFQASGSVSKSSVVKAGKLLGVNYLLVGDVYILNDQLIINARLTNTETGEIVFSKKQEGKTLGWLTLKTNIAKDLSSSLSQPFISPTIPDKEITVATITTFGNAIAAKDTGDLKKSENLIETIKEFNPDFKYLEDLTKEIEEIKKRLDKVEQDVEITTTDPIAAAKNYDQLGNFLEAEKYYQIGLKRLTKNQLGQYLLYNILLAELSFKYQDYKKSLYYSNLILDVYSLFDNAVFYKFQSLLNLKNDKELIEWSKNYLERANEINSYNIFNSEIDNYKRKNRIDGHIDDLIINRSCFPFCIQLNNFEFHQGSEEIFQTILGQFLTTNSLINGSNSTLIYLKNLNSKSNNSFEYEINEAFFHPKNHYISKVSSDKDQLIIAKSGDSYVGSYFEMSNGTLWTKGNPSECPCVRILPKSKYIKLKQFFIETNLQSSLYESEGWYSLLNKEPVNARKRFGQTIFYQMHESAFSYETLYEFIDSFIQDLDSVKVDGYQGLRDILDRESINYEGKGNLTFIDQLFKSNFTSRSDDLCNNIINFGHAYLIEGNLKEALISYKYFDPNYLIKDFKLTIFQIIQKDLSEFESLGLIKKKDMEFIINNLK